MIKNNSAILRSDSKPITKDDPLAIREHSFVSDVNSSSTPLPADTGGTDHIFVGDAIEILNFSAVVVSIFTDKDSANNGLIIEYSTTGADNTWYWNDKYSVSAMTAEGQGKVFTSNKNVRYMRVRFVNGTDAQNTFVLSTMIVPSVLHSSHNISNSIVPDDDAQLVKNVNTGQDPEGMFRNIKSTVRGSLACNLVDNYGFTAENTPMGEQRSVSPFVLAGGNFIGTTIDPNFWTTAVTLSGTVTQGSGQVLLSTGTTANSTTLIRSNRIGRYSGGSALRYRAIVQLTDGETGTANNVRQWGAMDLTYQNGAFYELNGTTLYAVTRKGGVDTKVAAANWSEESFTIDLNVHTYEIYWTNKHVYFVISDVLKHNMNASTETWSATTSLGLYATNNNTNSLNSNILLGIRVMTIAKLGNFETQPLSGFQSGTTAGVVLKYGAGNIHGLIISGVVNNSVITLYNNTAASGTVIWTSGAMGSQTQPYPLDFHNIPFSIGLTLVISGSNSNVFVAYE